MAKRTTKKATTTKKAGTRKTASRTTAKQLSVAEQGARLVAARNVKRELTRTGVQAAEYNRIRKNYQQATGSTNNAIGLDREAAVNVSRVVYRLSPLYRGMINSLANRVIGQGLELVAENDKARKAVEAFDRWAWRGKGVDYTRRHAFGQWQRLAFIQAARDGDCLVVEVDAGGDDWGFQVVESPLIVSPSRYSTEEMVDGVELDESGRVVQYHVGRWGPLGGYVDYSDIEPVSPEDGCLFGFFEDANAARGLPWQFAQLTRYLDINESHDAALAAMKMAAHIAAVVKTDDPGVTAARLKTSTDDSSYQNPSNQSGIWSTDQASILNLRTGESLDGFNSTQPNATVEMFTNLLMKSACAGAGIPVAVALGDFDGLSWSSSRMAMLLAHETAAPIQDDAADAFLYRPYRRFCERNGFTDDAYQEVHYQGPAMLSANPREDAQAAILRIQNNLGTLEDELAKDGKALKPVLEQREREVKAQADMGIAPLSTPGAKPIGEPANETEGADAP